MKGELSVRQEEQVALLQWEKDAIMEMEMGGIVASNPIAILVEKDATMI